MPHGLVKADHRMSNVARRRTTNELLIFDLDNTTIGPRFDAVADFLGGSNFIRLYSSGPSNIFLPRPESRQKWAEVYLREYAKAGGAHVELSEVLEETRILLAAHLFHDLKNWPANIFYWWRSDADSDVVTHAKRTAILRILKALLEEM
jgi:hypothetical protein